MGNTLKYVDPTGMEAVDSCAGGGCSGSINVTDSADFSGFYGFLNFSYNFSGGWG